MRDAVLLLAGGASRRLPGKLERELGGKAMILRVAENLRGGGRAMYVAAGGSFAPETDAALDAPLIVDRARFAGPLRALLDASTRIPADRIFAVAADQPHLEASVLDALTDAWRPGDEAAVPQHSGGIEPLAALYDRAALLRVGALCKRDGRAAMRDLLALLAVRFVSLESRYFTNVNTSDDLRRVTQTA
jgi:molybdopterin-guanine dinucleotide biosynthesis protein A